MSDRPLVSIIMPVFNGEKYIKDSINSILNQEYVNWELLIVNDGSTDQSKEIIRSFTDQRIFYFEQSNLGVSAARNMGLRNMKGDYFCFLDADDVFPINSIGSRLEIFKQSDSIQFVDGRVDVFNQSLTELIRVRNASVQGSPFNDLLNMNPGVFFSPTWMVKKTKGVTYAFSEDMKHLEDLYFYFGISEQGDFAFTNETILKYRTHDQSAMQNLDGIAIGYTQLVSRVLVDFSEKLTFIQKWIFKIRVRKIMALSFFAAKQWKKGFAYLMSGRV